MKENCSSLRFENPSLYQRRTTKDPMTKVFYMIFSRLWTFKIAKIKWGSFEIIPLLLWAFFIALCFLHRFANVFPLRVILLILLNVWKFADIWNSYLRVEEIQDINSMDALGTLNYLQRFPVTLQPQGWPCGLSYIVKTDCNAKIVGLIPSAAKGSFVWLCKAVARRQTL